MKTLCIAINFFCAGMNAGVVIIRLSEGRKLESLTLNLFSMTFSVLVGIAIAI